MDFQDQQIISFQGAFFLSRMYAHSSEQLNLLFLLNKVMCSDILGYLLL